MSMALSFPCGRKNWRPIAAWRKRPARFGASTGALEFHECVADDVKDGKRTSFPRSVKLKRGETVVFSWITYRSRAERDRIMAKVMKDKRIAAMMSVKDIPFDSKRMIFGGFNTLVIV